MTTSFTSILKLSLALALFFITILAVSALPVTVEDGDLNVSEDGYFGGNVGIGDASPDAKLDVAGNTQIDGTLTVSSSSDSSIAGDLGVRVTSPEARIHTFGGSSGASHVAFNWRVADGLLMENDGDLILTMDSPNTTTSEIWFHDTEGIAGRVRYEHTDDVLELWVGNPILWGYNTEIVINEDSRGDRDFRVESDGNANMLFIDSSTNRVGIGTATPNKELTVIGDTNFTGDIYLDGGLCVGDAGCAVGADGTGLFEGDLTVEGQGGFNGAAPTGKYGIKATGTGGGLLTLGGGGVMGYAETNLNTLGILGYSYNYLGFNSTYGIYAVQGEGGEGAGYFDGDVSIANGNITSTSTSFRIESSGDVIVRLG